LQVRELIFLRIYPGRSNVVDCLLGSIQPFGLFWERKGDEDIAKESNAGKRQQGGWMKGGTSRN